jgi:hypothetical protein
LGKLLALPANIRLGWKGLPGAKTQVYCKNLYITAVKKFYRIGPRVVICNCKLFTALATEGKCYKHFTTVTSDKLLLAKILGNMKGEY